MRSEFLCFQDSVIHPPVWYSLIWPLNQIHLATWPIISCGIFFLNPTQFCHYFIPYGLQHLFYVFQDSQSFSLTPGTVVSGLSSESVAMVTQPFMHCGNHYHHLDAFSQVPPSTLQNERGLVFQAFAGAVRKYLQHYRACILMLSTEKREGLTVTGLRYKLNKLLNQMRWVSRSCLQYSSAAPCIVSCFERNRDWQLHCFCSIRYLAEIWYGGWRSQVLPGSIPIGKYRLNV